MSETSRPRTSNRRDCIKTMAAAGGAAALASCTPGTEGALGASDDQGSADMEARHFPEGYPPYPSAEATETAFAEHVSPGNVGVMRAFGTELHFGQREGARVQDAFTGKWYWDCHRNGTLYNLGHRNPDIIAAVKEALHQLEIGNLLLVSGYKAKAAEKLIVSTDGALTGVTYTASGAESTEVAIRATRGMTRRTKLVSIEASYHGHTCFAMAAGDSADNHERYLLDFDDFVFVPYNDVDAMAAAVDDATAAVMIESSPAQAGFPVPDPGYFQAVMDICRKHGAKLIVDEVQTGLGATGKFWFWQHHGIVPDIMTTAKGLGGGILANAAVLLAPEVKEWFFDTAIPHSSTFGGNELGCVATAKVCDLTMAPAFLEHVNALSEQFAEGLRGGPYQVNQHGLCMGILSQEMGKMEMTARLFEAGIFTVPAWYTDGGVEFRPILTLTENEADEIIGIFRDTVG